MSDYKILPQSEDALEKDVDAPVALSRPSSTKLFVLAAYVLMVVNIFLMIANGAARIRMETSLTNVMPVHDPRTLPQPDQYFGLPENSRNKSEPSNQGSPIPY